jgi:mRNA-capping enzyme
MSYKKKDLLALPPRWLNCPRKANSLVADKFLAFKVPLSAKFDQKMPQDCRFNAKMLIESVKRSYGNKKLGLIIDLTNTNRFYDADSEIKQQGIKYLKINCKGHDETPTREDTQLFLNFCENFIRQNPLALIGIHCTHGFNRSGFLICSYLVEKLDFSIDMAISMFALSRPNGIYKQDYINELYKR